MAETAYRLSIYGGLLRATGRLPTLPATRWQMARFEKRWCVSLRIPHCQLYAGTHTVASKNKIPPISQAKADATSAVLDR
jgi:hypothetical protein